ncbi:D-allose transport system permease protein AlsC [Austwickia sp. TVS 96-490-7B]|uniref:ABC transporter permease n=1 Tax=Austwickia sp. TVS 96-490-7B TaxID=2830843 RepID=UPI001C58BB74|nr:ABC transporter permease [Austwickia sp. TVS 96-490-7B]MBW3084722.1 D-allose transport system permease protein AlsC [Austwickia sp. TVS 96-490-7B]
MPDLTQAPWLRRILRSGGTRSSFVRMLAVTALIFVVFSLAAPSVFLSGDNFQFIALAAPEIAVIALAMSLTMLTAGIDLSVVTVSNLSAIVAARVMIDGGGGPGAIVAGVLTAMVVALACGAVNAVLIARLEVPPILATLGSSQLFAGIALVVSQGTVIKGLPVAFTQFALTTVAGIPVIFVIMLVLAVLVAVLVERTPLGVRMRLVGANPHAADYSGIRRVVVLSSTYLISSGLAGVAGLIISSRASGANSQYGASYVLLAIVIAVLAGVDPDGGYITVPGVVIAVLALQMLGTGLHAIQDSSHVVNIAQGLLLIVMVLLNTWWPTLREHLRLRKEVAQ